ncbi:twin-arginine translocation signal domain-containing protein, partial [Enterobacter hormaechei]
MPQHRRRFLQSTLALAAAPALSIAQPRIVLKAGDQK